MITAEHECKKDKEGYCEICGADLELIESLKRAKTEKSIPYTPTE